MYLDDDSLNRSVTVVNAGLFGPDSLILITPDSVGDTTFYHGQDSLVMNYKRFYISYLPERAAVVDSAFKALIDSGEIRWIRNYRLCPCIVVSYLEFCKSAIHTLTNYDKSSLQPLPVSCLLDP